MTGHLAWHRLEAETLTDDEHTHLQGCPRCRVDRRELLASSAGDGPADATDALLRAQAVASDTLSAWRSGSFAPREPVVRDLLPAASRFGNYVLEGLIGTGGMAVVYLARHAELRTPHAVKVLAAPGQGLRERLLQEGRLQGGLKHPNIVGVTDVIEVDGSPALVLEYVPGPSLDRVLRSVPLTLAEADALAIDVLTGMAAAHASGFVHRDLKPSNVLVDPTGKRAVARVADFGLAKVVVGEHEAQNTRTGGLLGTLVYMAPEQVRDPRQADTRSDVFSLGALLYELVTGLRCFGGVDMVDVVQRITTGRRDRLPGDVPVRMSRAIDAALELDPEQRPADASALLALWIDGRADRPSAWEPAKLALLADQVAIQPLPGSLPAPLPRWPVAVAAALGLLGAASWMLGGAPVDQGAIMLVRDLGGAPGHAPHTQLSAVFSPDLRGVYTAACVTADGRCAASTPQPDGWVPLVAAPMPTALTQPVGTVQLAGLEAHPDGARYVGTGEPTGETGLVLDGFTAPLPWPLPDRVGLLGDPAVPVSIGPDAGTTVRWTAGGAGSPFLEVRPRIGGGGRLYSLVDDGEFTLPPDAFGPTPSQTDLIFGRQERAEVEVDGRPVQVLARAQQWLTVVRVEPDRVPFPTMGHCEESKYRPSLAPGRYWALFDRAAAAPTATNWPCMDATIRGWSAVHPIAVPANGRLGVYAHQPGGELALWRAENPYCHPSDCVAGADRPGETEALILEGDGTEHTWNVGIAEVAARGGLYLVDLVELADPTLQRPEIRWSDGSMAVHIEHPADVEFRFGLAETQSPNGWYGEDCLHGNTDPVVRECHAIVGADLALRRIHIAEQVRGGETTLWWSEVGESATFVLEAPNLQDEAGTPRCWVWGDAPEYYERLGCAPLQADPTTPPAPSPR